MVEQDTSKERIAGAGNGWLNLASGRNLGEMTVYYTVPLIISTRTQNRRLPVNTNSQQLSLTRGIV
jgi:hypothetical protein